MIKIIFSILFFLSFSYGESELNPPSRHKQFLSYGQFFDPSMNVVFRNDSRGWAAAGGSIALLEWKDSQSQLVVHGTANTSYEASTGASTVHVETSDARVGLAYDSILDPTTRFAIIWTHQSGHISDNVPDIDLMGPDLGNEAFDFRYVKDVESQFRFGGGLRPFLITTPTIPSFGAEQFMEWYPHSMSSNPHELSPFMAVGLEEYGAKNIDVTVHLQAGYVVGSHFVEHPGPSQRYVIGFYNGSDPRLKYFQFKNRYAQFGYIGVFFDL